MSPTTQTVIALLLVAFAAAWLLRSWFGKRKQTGCGSEGCAAVSPEVKALRQKLSKR